MLLVGGGLANSLLALSLRSQRPDLKTVMLERRTQAEDAHTWCLFRSDVDVAAWRRIGPLLDPVWDGYDVSFPTYERRLDATYGRLSESALGKAVDEALGDHLRRGCDVVEVGEHDVRLADGVRFSAPLVIDGRGYRQSDRLSLAYQKFLGLRLRLKAPHGLVRPVVMDSSVRQCDGFRFLYVLPLSATELLVEDTRYSDSPLLSAACLEGDVLRYARAQGWGVDSVVGRETGVLPVTLDGDLEAFLDEGGPAAAVGLRGGFFHPTTGYSMACALRVAEVVAGSPQLTTAAVRGALRRTAIRTWKAQGFYRAINRMMFLAAEPDQRYRVLERFYRLPEPLIQRFYAGRLTAFDKARVLIGRPPVPLKRAWSAIPASAARERLNA